MSSYTPLDKHIEEVGYPRTEFLDINRAGNNVLPVLNIVPSSLEDGFYIVTVPHGNGTAGYTLARYKDREKFSLITDSVPNHLYSSIIKNIILKDYDDSVKYNMILYILYYRVVYSSNTPLTNQDITEGVIIHLSNMIKLMIEREHSTYRHKPAVSDAIEAFRRLLKIERIHVGIRPKLNLRR